MKNTKKPKLKSIKKVASLEKSLENNEIQNLLGSKNVISTCSG
jgi:hypothetical protein